MLMRRFIVVALTLLSCTTTWGNSNSQTPGGKLDPVLNYSTYVRVPPGARFGEAIDAYSSANAKGEVCVSLVDLSAERPATIAKLAVNGSLAYQTELPISSPVAGVSPVAAVAVDTTGNCYLALAIPASGPTLAYVIKLDTSGQLAYSYQVGGSGSVTPFAIAVDSSGEVYLSGQVAEVDFPVSNAFQSTYGGGSADGFLLKLDATGSTLLFATYFGGSAFDEVRAMALDPAGNVVVVGDTVSTNFPLSASPMSSSGSTFIAKFTSSGTLSYSTFLPSTHNFALAVAVDSTGAAYLIDGTSAPNPVSITKVDPGGSAIVYSYSIAPTNSSPNAIAVDGSGQAYVAGFATATSTLPMVAPIQGAFQGGRTDGFVLVLDPTGTNIVFSTFLGGPGNEFPYSLALDSSRNVYVSGTTSGAFPLVNPDDGAYLPFPTCVQDRDGGQCGTAYVFVSKISQTSTTALALPSSVDFENIPVGSTSASVGVLLANVGTNPISLGTVQVSGDFALTNNCPATLGAAAACLLDVTFAPQVSGSRTGSVVVNDNAGGPHTINLTGAGTGSVNALPTTVNFGNQQVGTLSPYQLVVLTNSSPLFPAVTITNQQVTGDFMLSGGLQCGSLLNPQSQCVISVAFSPTAAGVRSGTLTITDSDPSSPQIVTLTGNGVVSGSLGVAIASGSPASATVSAGQNATYNLAIGGKGISGAVILSCSGAPIGATCSVPTSLTLSASSSTNFAVTVTTTSRTLAAQNNATTLPWLWASIVMVCFIGFRKTRAGLATLLVAACLLAGCGGSGSTTTTPPPTTNPSGTPAGTYTITLTATTSSTTQSVDLTLIVN
jgi:hypothetical protein